MTAIGRVHTTFWVLVVIAVLATGALSGALTWADGPVAAATVAISGLVVVITILLAVRIIVVLAGRRS